MRGEWAKRAQAVVDEERGLAEPGKRGPGALIVAPRLLRESRVKWDVRGRLGGYRQGGGVVFALSERREGFTFGVVVSGEGAERGEETSAVLFRFCALVVFPQAM